jgi:hypothetical protein
MQLKNEKWETFPNQATGLIERKIGCLSRDKFGDIWTFLSVVCHADFLEWRALFGRLSCRMSLLVCCLSS